MSAVMGVTSFINALGRNGGVWLVVTLLKSEADEYVDDEHEDVGLWFTWNLDMRLRLTSKWLGVREWLKLTVVGELVNGTGDEHVDEQMDTGRRPNFNDLGSSLLAVCCWRPFATSNLLFGVSLPDGGVLVPPLSCSCVVALLVCSGMQEEDDEDDDDDDEDDVDDEDKHDTICCLLVDEPWFVAVSNLGCMVK